MRTTHLSFSLLAALATACAGSSEPKQAEGNEGTPAVTPAVTPADGGRPGTNARAGDARGGEGAAASAGTPALTIIGVQVESPLAATCGIALPPAAFFEFDSANLDLPANSSLHEVATCLTSGPLAGRKVELIGHTDPRGDDEYNRKLGRSRVQSVQDFLQKRGVPEANIVLRSMGERRAEEAEPGGWPMDRRVDVRLLPK